MNGGSVLMPPSAPYAKPPPGLVPKPRPNYSKLGMRVLELAPHLTESD